MARSFKILATLLMVALGSFLVVACGDDDSGSGGKTGGSMTILGLSYPDYLDPALSYTVDGWQALLQVYPGLLVYPHESGLDGAQPQPGLAEALPEITNGDKTYNLKLREGLKYSDGSPVKASDFKSSIERVLAMDSQGVGLGYTNIEGADEFLETKKGGVTGIKTDDDTGDITIDLVEPRGAFTYELAIPFAAVVPGDTPRKNQTKSPPPSTGRYTIENVKVNDSYTLVRNPNFSKSLEGTAVDAAKVDTINVKIVRSNANAATQISQNEADFMIDNPPADRIAEIQSQYPDRYRQFSTPSTFYFFMNSEAPPFDDVKVRQAVNFAIDPDAINRVQGGVIEPGNTILPKTVPGYKDWPNLYPHNPDKAKQLIKEAGVEGADVTVWGNPEDPTKPTVEYYADVLNEIGLDAKVKIIPAETYFATIGDRSVKAQTGWANWFQDYPHPADFIDILLNPDKVVATGNNNYSYNAADQELADKINALLPQQITSETESQWADVDRYIQEKAYWGTYGTRKQSTFFSDRMDFESCKGDDWPVGTHDWAQFCLK